MPQPRCLCAGLLVADHLSSPISHFPQAGELVLADALTLSIGGCAANAAMDLARVGVDCAAVGCVGSDPFGRFVIETLRHAGVGVQFVRQLPESHTSATLIINVKGQDRRFVHTMGANARLSAAEIPLEALDQCQVFYVGGYLLMPALEQHALASLFRRVKDHGGKTLLDVVLPGPGDHMRQLEALLPVTDVFLPNSDEGRLITGYENPRDQAQAFLDAGVGTAVITCGEQGTLLLNNRVKLRAGRYPVNYVGGTGSGDAFDAGYITGLLEGADELGCLKWGSALGASCVRSISATDSVFTREEALEFMRQTPLEIETLR